MAAHLNTRTAIEQRGAGRFLWAKVMAANDIHKEMLPMYGERFPDDDAVEWAVCVWFRQQPQEFDAAGFQGFVKRWEKCLNLFGDYVEK